MSSEESVQLKRRISTFGVTMYGIGNILGAGIYALIGEVLGITGNFSWLAFILAAIVGGLTGLSYAELSAMYPKSAAEFVYAQEAFQNRLVSFLLGWIIIFSGLFSAATVALSFGGYLAALLGIPETWVIIVIGLVLVFALSGINHFGIRESTWTNIVFTLVEAVGLVLIILIGIPFIGTVNYFELPPAAPMTAIFSAVALIFFAYIGFEDIANIAEEVKDPNRSLPKGIVYSIIVTTIIYGFVSLSIVSILPYSEISGSPAPLNAVASAVLGPVGGLVMSIIALFATANTVLIIMIVNSRMIFGMARDRALPHRFSILSVKRQTPSNAILVTMSFTMALLFFGDLTLVANATVVGVIITFFLVNLSAIALRRKNPDKIRPFKIWPSIKNVPIPALIGVIVCVSLLFTFNLLIVGIQVAIIVAGILVFYAVRSRFQEKTEPS